MIREPNYIVCVSAFSEFQALYGMEALADVRLQSARIPRELGVYEGEEMKENLRGVGLEMKVCEKMERTLGRWKGI
jgi:hypothetical protein